MKKLESLVAPLIFVSGFLAVAPLINQDSAKKGIDAVQTYLVSVPTGVLVGCLVHRFYELLESRGYSFQKKRI